jgi:hypothetical protein
MSQTEKNFVLCDRVAWDDRPGKNAAGQDELVRGMMLLRVSGFLHGHKFGRSVSGGGDCLKLLARIERKVNRIGLPMLRQNLVTFFGTVESCWPFLEESVHARRLQMREPFLFMLARLLSDHEVFWKQPDEKELVVPARILHDLRRISLTDPNIMNLLHRGRAATDILYETVVHNLNKGRSTNRLVDRWKTGNGLPPKDDEDDDSEVAA